MTDAVDYSASAVERLRVRLVLLDSRAGRRDAADMVVALRDALDAAERERDDAMAAHSAAVCRVLDADATGYERGVREAAACCDAAKAGALENYGVAESVGADMAKNRILALLPKETNDAE